MTTTRAEHVKWCKKRAHHEYAWRKAKGDIEGGMRAAVASMMSDLSKHPETADMGMMALVVAMTVRDEHSLFAFIDGFAE